MHYRSIFFSDLHLGLKYTRIEELTEFLKENDCEMLYLVGDIIDYRALIRRWYWNDDYNFFIQKVLKKSRKGTRIFYITGNHDDFLRKFGDTLDLGSIKILESMIHISSSGKKYLVSHGDLCDGFLHSVYFFKVIGSILHDMVLGVNHYFNKVMSIVNLGPWPISYVFTRNTKKSIRNFETEMVNAAVKNGCDGVVCGHIHESDQKIINDVEYINCGDFVENATLVVEYENGKLELIDLNKNRV